MLRLLLRGLRYVVGGLWNEIADEVRASLGESP